VTFLTSLVAFGWKARKNICQQASPGFPRLRSGQALRLRAISRLLCDESARRFAQDDAFVGASKNIRLEVQKSERATPLGDVALCCPICRGSGSASRSQCRSARNRLVATDTARGSRTIPLSQRCKSFLGATREPRFRVSLVALRLLSPAGEFLLRCF
jgi:hypothetical protein